MNTFTSLKTYRTIKEQNADCVVLARMGDYYEAFEDDAHTLADACDLYFLTRVIGGQRVDMAGVIYHGLHALVTKLTAAGYNVAIAESSTNVRRVVNAIGAS